MPTAIVYPTTLPGPEQWGIKPAERRAMSALRQPGGSYRTRSRDKSDTVSASWMYTAGDMAVWLPWFTDTLVSGQKWFAAYVPGVGATARIVKYLPGSIKKNHLGNGVFVITAQLELRGRSVAVTG